MISPRHILLATVAFTAAALPAQRMTVRDTIVALPMFSTCMDGSSHKTVASGYRLRSLNIDLAPLVGKALEISGTAIFITCQWIEVDSVRVLDAGQRSVATNEGGIAKVEFFGDAALGDVFMLYLSGGLLTSPIFLPSIDGPIHIDPASMVYAGLGISLGSTSPYATLSTPMSAALLGVAFFDQAVVLRAGTPTMTNVDTFRFK